MSTYEMLCVIWDYLCNFKKCEKHPLRSVNFSKGAAWSNFTKSNTPPWMFFTFLKITQIVLNCSTHHMQLVNSYLRNGKRFFFSFQKNRRLVQGNKVMKNQLNTGKTLYVWIFSSNPFLTFLLPMIMVRLLYHGYGRFTFLLRESIF